MQAVICAQGVLGDQLALVFRGSKRYSFDSFHVSPPKGVDTAGFLCVGADDLSRKGHEEAVSWITQLRIATAHPCRLWPVLIFGYRTHVAFLRSLRVPRMLASPGIEYVQLPFLLKEHDHTVTSLERAPVLSERVIEDYLQDFGHIKRLGDHLAHTLGNFHAVFRLIEGAYQAGSLSGDDYLDLDLAVESAIKANPRLSNYLAFQEFRYLRSRRTGRSQDPPAPQSKPIASGSRILLIDDAASLGWAQTLSRLVLGEESYRSSSSEKSFSQLSSAGFDAIGRPSPFDESGEDDFLNDLLQWAGGPKGSKVIERADLIFIDLRLRRTRDEKVLAQDCSGVRVLMKIRKVNAGVPIIVLTASRKARSLDAVLQAGADDYFIKDAGDAGEDGEALKGYYQNFVEKVELALRTTYRREIWKGILPVVKSHSAVANHLKKALACLRQRPIKYEQETLQYSPWAAAIIELDSAMEVYVNYDSAGAATYYNAVARFFQGRNPSKANMVILLGYLRNRAAHSRQYKITESDARIAFGLALLAMESARINMKLVAGHGQLNMQEAVRKTVLCLVKLVTDKTPSLSSPPKFRCMDDLALIVDGKDLLFTYAADFLLGPVIDSRRSLNEYLAAASLWRLEQLVKGTASHRATGSPIIVTSWDQKKTRWVWSDHGEYVEIEQPRATVGFPCMNDGSHLQAFRKDEHEAWEPWGPSFH